MRRSLLSKRTTRQSLPVLSLHRKFAKGYLGKANTFLQEKSFAKLVETKEFPDFLPDRSFGESQKASDRGRYSEDSTAQVHYEFESIGLA